MRRAIGLSLAFAACAGWAQVSRVWTNVVNYPDDLANTVDGWSATRADDADSLRCAADDFVIARPTRVARIVYYAVPIGGPNILGGDWYVYADGGGVPGPLVAAGFDQFLEIQDTGIFNAALGDTVRRHTMRPLNLLLRPGRYFLGFRTVQSFEGGAGKNGALSTRVRLGTSRALWSFGVQRDGTVTSGWTPLSTFNQFPDNEWSFEIWGIGPTPTP